MSIDLVTDFVEKAPHDPASAWDYAAVKQMGGMNVPSTLLGDQEALLRGDQHRLWLKWFVEGLVSPFGAAIIPSVGRLDVFEAVLKRVDGLYPGIDGVRRKKLTETITNHVFAEVERVKNGAVRDFANASTRLSLIAAVTPPRCYICGFQFSSEARDAFLRIKGRNPVKTPSLIDVLRPRGLCERDIKIEIEHIVPVAAGGSGQSNLRLACGWCNKYKSDRVSIYEATFMAPRTRSFKIGPNALLELPNPFWTVRVLALRGRCQYVGGCTHTAADSELFISLSDWKGSPNPTNLSVYCGSHDPIATARLQNRANVERIWRERKS